ncbi:hypothetical protein LINGRAHAP2_LOCUS35004, partial [Linum grandiflorum]
MTTNMAESINGAFKGIRSLPICALVRSTFYRLTANFEKRRNKVIADRRNGEVWTEYCRKIMADRGIASATYDVRPFDHTAGEYDVISPFRSQTRPGGNTYRVYLYHGHRSGYCSCGIFQHSKMPCVHAYAVCNSVNLNPYDYVNLMFNVSTIHDIYKTSFRPINGPEDWPTHEGKLIPNESLHRAQGRPKHSRIRNEMDWTDGVAPHCSTCNGEGHTRGNCPSIP